MKKKHVFWDTLRKKAIFLDTIGGWLGKILTLKYGDLNDFKNMQEEYIFDPIFKNVFWDTLSKKAIFLDTLGGLIR